MGWGSSRVRVNEQSSMVTQAVAVWGVRGSSRVRVNEQSSMVQQQQQVGGIVWGFNFRGAAAASRVLGYLGLKGSGPPGLGSFRV